MRRDLIQESKKLQAITEAREPDPWKRCLQLIFLLLSILLLSYYSSCLRSINLSSTTALLNNLDHFINRKAIFLFFNAILCFLVKDSGLLGLCRTPVNKPYDEFLVSKGGHQNPKATTVETEADVSKATMESPKSLELVVIEERGRGDEDGVADIEIKTRAVEKAMEERARCLELAVIGGGDEQGKELVGVDEMKDVENIDELNRKFEEFIERVKKERRMEDLQVVLV
ncbi:hypothetical protein COCNU_scaffold009624G000010 [Cocos nucifera]|nr:hypothetical protein [Cocos nucifera]